MTAQLQTLIENAWENRTELSPANAGGSLIQSIAMAARARRTTAKMIALPRVVTDQLVDGAEGDGLDEHRDDDEQPVRRPYGY